MQTAHLSSLRQGRHPEAGLIHLLACLGIVLLHELDCRLMHLQLHACTALHPSCHDRMQKQTKKKAMLVGDCSANQWHAELAMHT